MGEPFRGVADPHPSVSALPRRLTPAGIVAASSALGVAALVAPLVYELADAGFVWWTPAVAALPALLLARGALALRLRPAATAALLAVAGGACGLAARYAGQIWAWCWRTGYEVTLRDFLATDPPRARVLFAVLGLALGLACAAPVAAAAWWRARGALDAAEQVLFSCGFWLVGAAGISALGLTLDRGAHYPIAICTALAGVGLVAAGALALRAQDWWLARVAARAVPGWSTEAATPGDRDEEGAVRVRPSEALSFGDVLVHRPPAPEGAPYRSAPARVVVARAAPFAVQRFAPQGWVVLSTFALFAAAVAGWAVIDDLTRSFAYAWWEWPLLGP